MITEQTPSAPPYIADRALFEAAQDLLTQFGAFARHEAATRAKQSRALGNVLHYCRWRTVERLIGVLCEAPEGATVH